MTVDQPPLAVHIIWHLADSDSASPIIDELSKRLSRDVDKPFSRNLNLPLFFYSSKVDQEPPELPEALASNDVVLFFTSVNTCGNTAWRKYAVSVAGSGLPVVCIALDDDGLKLPAELSAINALRSFEWPQEHRLSHALLAISHEIYRHGLVDVEPDAVGKDSSVSVFLSHAKNDELGKAYAEAVKQYVDETNLKRFFDSDEISPGFRFDDEIVGSIAESTLISFVGDNYASRYWCQREVLCAKENSRPMVAVSCALDCEDRLFPANSNVPCLHVPSDQSPLEASVLKILAYAMIETIRFEHNKVCLAYYQSAGWIPEDCMITARPPELRQLLKLKRVTNTPRVCYPEPPIFLEEADWHEQLGVEAFTPLWSSTDRTVFEGMNVGISISEPSEGTIIGRHLPIDQLTRLSQDVARHLLARSGKLHYGGDLRPNGFTEFILDEAIALSNRQKPNTIFVHNHLAWPLYENGDELKRWVAKYGDILETVHHEIPKDVIDLVEPSMFLAPTDTGSRYIWSRCLSEMRLKSTQALDARICVGGRFADYKGKMPGVLEEIILAIEVGTPIYLLGAFGGVVGELAKYLLSGEFPEYFTEGWQLHANEGYEELQGWAAERHHAADYTKMAEILGGLEIARLAAQSGLSCNDYKRLLVTPFVDEGIYIVMKGLRKLSNQN